jgi:hypothetical protein
MSQHTSSPRYGPGHPSVCVNSRERTPPSLEHEHLCNFGSQRRRPVVVHSEEVRGHCIQQRRRGAWRVKREMQVQDDQSIMRKKSQALTRHARAAGCGRRSVFCTLSTTMASALSSFGSSLATNSIRHLRISSSGRPPVGVDASPRPRCVQLHALGGENRARPPPAFCPSRAKRSSSTHETSYFVLTRLRS